MEHDSAHARATRMLRDSGYSGGHGEAPTEPAVTRMKRKHGGHVGGKNADARPDRRARGGAMNGVVSVDRRYDAAGIDQPHGPEKRAAGGAMRHKTGGKHAPINITIKTGGGAGAGGQAEKQAAAQKGLQAGMMIGRRMGAGAGGPPMPPPGGPPPGGPPMGGPPGMPPHPPMAGPPPGAGAPMPPRPPGMMASGGDVRMRDERGRFLGGAV